MVKVRGEMMMRREGQSVRQITRVYNYTLDDDDDDDNDDDDDDDDDDGSSHMLFTMFTESNNLVIFSLMYNCFEKKIIIVKK